jgi:nitroreductase
MTDLLKLDPDQLLTTTRAVRKRLDLDRPVPMELVRECLEVALQAPTGSNAQGWHFVVVRDQAKRAQLAEIYRKAWAQYPALPSSVMNVHKDDPSMAPLQERIASSADYLAANLERVPVFVIPCVDGRFDAIPPPFASLAQASMYGSILPATWSFMLAARARGLGTCWTSLHLWYEEEAAQVLGIPYAEITQCALIPVAFTKGTEFRAGARRGLDRFLHVDRW